MQKSHIQSPSSVECKKNFRIFRNIFITEIGLYIIVFIPSEAMSNFSTDFQQSKHINPILYEKNYENRREMQNKMKNCIKVQMLSSSYERNLPASTNIPHRMEILPKFVIFCFQ